MNGRYIIHIEHVMLIKRGITFKLANQLLFIRIISCILYCVPANLKRLATPHTTWWHTYNT